MDSSGIGGQVWLAQWLDRAMWSNSTLLRRSLADVIRFGGGLRAAIAAARARGLHLLLCVDRYGRKQVIATGGSFEVIC